MRLRLLHRNRLLTLYHSLPGGKKKTAAIQHESSKPRKISAGNKKDTTADDDALQSKPRLTTPELEFDYDRSQLRDP
jgi:hypothetical protein